MKSTGLRLIIPLAVFVLIGIGLVSNSGFGNLSAIGWQDIVVLCPLGALATMLAQRLIIPQAVVSLVIAVVLILALGRTFCAWICPVPVMQRLSSVTKEGRHVAKPALSNSKRYSCGSECSKKRKILDSRHVILGGSLLSAAVFGFPVFCLVCPVGLSFATLFAVIRLFANGDMSWSLLLMPLVLIIEVILLKRWCSMLCPLSAFMSLVGKANRTFKPTIDQSKCLATAQGKACSVCADSCPQQINPRQPELGDGWSECTKCRVCVESCPTKSITMPLISRNTKTEDTRRGSDAREHSNHR